MAWENRGSGRYYYRKKRSGRSVFSKYVGHGLPAYQAYIEDLKERKWRKEVFEAMKQERSRVERLFLNANKLNRLAKCFIIAKMIALGYYNHKGQWRRR
jgi:hypothetical protein